MMTNIVVIVSDHLSTRAVGAYGESDWADTPNIDRLAERGVVFENMYTSYPLCGPSRAAFWTGRFPHDTGVLSNGLRVQDPDILPNASVPEDMPTIGETFKRAGYNTIHFGKCHDSGGLRGFDIVPDGIRESESVPAGYPENNDTWRDHWAMDRFGEWAEGGFPEPFCAVVDLQNPHNICGWIGEHNSLDGPVEHAISPKNLPELPANNKVVNWESLPLPVRYICCSHNRGAQSSHYTDEDWRYYIDAFRHYAKMADEHVGTILRLLEAGGVLDDTLVILMADHGDGMGSHQMATKQVSFYEETARVPFIAAGPGVRSGGQKVAALTSLLDLFPGLCDYAGIQVPDGLPGVSFAPLLQGAVIQREFVVAEWYTEWGCTVSPGRMIRSARFKYTSYLEGSVGAGDPTGGEELYDLDMDRGEMVNLATDTAYCEVLLQHRDMLKRHIRDQADPFYTQKVVVDKRWRSHPPGYQHHSGPTAPMVAGR
ncbi:MAG: sulfatase [Candidatus Latescibacterota bacterium]